MAHSDNPALLSGSTNGRPISISVTSSPGTTIHTVSANTDGATYHQVYLYVNNIDGAGTHKLYLQLGGTSTADTVIIDIPANGLPIEALNGENMFNGGVSIKAYANAANTINVWGRVNIITRPNKLGQ